MLEMRGIDSGKPFTATVQIESKDSFGRRLRPAHQGLHGKRRELRLPDLVLARHHDARVHPQAARSDAVVAVHIAGFHQRVGQIEGGM